MRTVSDNIAQLLQPVVTELGFEYVGAQLGQAESGLTLRVYIDGEKGVLVDDCATVSHQISAVLDVEDIIKSAYALEVSSPGIERPLFTIDQFESHVGQIVKVKMNIMVAGRRNFTGLLAAVEDSRAVVEVDGEEYLLPVDEMESARLVMFNQKR